MCYLNTLKKQITRQDNCRWRFTITIQLWARSSTSSIKHWCQCLAQFSTLNIHHPVMYKVSTYTECKPLCLVLKSCIFSTYYSPWSLFYDLCAILHLLQCKTFFGLLTQFKKKKKIMCKMYFLPPGVLSNTKWDICRLLCGEKWLLSCKWLVRLSWANQTKKGFIFTSVMSCYCNVDCWLDGKLYLLYEGNVTERTGGKKRENCIAVSKSGNSKVIWLMAELHE